MLAYKIEYGDTSLQNYIDMLMLDCDIRYIDIGLWY